MFACIFMIAFLPFVLFGKTFLSSATDGFLQHYPLLVKMRHLAGDFVRGNGLHFWNEDIGLGGDLIGNLSIILTDPFNYIAILFPIDKLDIGYSIAYILRIYVAGLCMAWYLAYHKCDNRQLVIGAVSYALCNWAVGAINHGFFLLPLILFPLVILGIDIVFDKKRSKLLVVSIVLCLITYIYFAYMTAIFALIYVIVRYFFDQKSDNRTLSGFFRMVGVLVLHIVIACCIAAPILVTMLYTLVNASKSGGTIESMLPSVKEVFRYFSALTNDREVFSHYSYIGTNALMAAMIPMIFSRKNREQNRLSVIMFAFSLLMVEIPLWGRLMNAFSYRMGRWCYVTAFFFVYAGVTALNIFLGMNIAEKKKTVGWVLGLTAINICGQLLVQSCNASGMVVSMWNLFCMMLFIFSTDAKNIVIYTLLVINMGVTYLLGFSPLNGDKLSEFMNKGDSYKQYASSVMKAYGTLEKQDKDFFRTDFVDHIAEKGYYSYAATPPNENLFWEARGLSGYLSTLNGHVLDFYKGLCNSPSTIRRVYTFSNDNRVRLNYLMGVNYYLYCINQDNPEASNKQYAGYGYSDYNEIKNVGVLQNDFRAGLGYVFSNVLTEEDYDALSPLEKEQALMQAAVIDEGTNNSLALPEAAVTTKITELEYTIDEESQIHPENNSFETGNKEKKLVLNVEECSDCEIYLLLDGLKKNHYSSDEWKDITLGETPSVYDSRKYDFTHVSETIYDNFQCFITKDDILKRIVNACNEPRGVIDNTMYLANLGYHEKTDGDITISFPTPGKYVYDSLKVLAVPVDTFAVQAKILEQNRLKVLENREDLITGKVTAAEDGVLYLSMVYTPGWKVYIDGKEAKTFVTDVCFTGCYIEKGEHDVRLVYRPVGWVPSLVLCAVGFTAFIAMAIPKKRSRK